MSNLKARVELALDEIRPFLKTDGCEIELKEIKKNILKVQLLGNCAECTVNQITLKQGFELTIKKHAPEIKEVISVQ